MAKRMELLITHPEMRTMFSENASTNAKERFSLDMMTIRYLDYYYEVIESWTEKKGIDK